MLRSLLSCLLVLALTAQASAQTPPSATTTKHTTAAHQKTTVRHPAAKRRTTVRKVSTKKMGASTQVRVAPASGAATAATSRMDGASGSHANADGKGQGVYAAPGEPVNLQTTPTSGYDGPATGHSKTSKAPTTLTPR